MLLPLVVVAILFVSCAELDEASLYTHTPLNYVNDIEPILDQSCIRCHGIDEIRGGLYLTEYDSIIVAKDKILNNIRNNGTDNMYQYLNSPVDANKIRDWIEIDNLAYE